MSLGTGDTSGGTAAGRPAGLSAGLRGVDPAAGKVGAGAPLTQGECGVDGGVVRHDVPIDVTSDSESSRIPLLLQSGNVPLVSVLFRRYPGPPPNTPMCLEHLARQPLNQTFRPTCDTQG